MDPTAAESVSELPRYPVDTRDVPASQPLPLLRPGTATPHGAGGPYRVYIRSDVEIRRFGLTEGCAGCRAIQEGLPPRLHSEACRSRIERAMAEDEALKKRVEEAGRRREEGEIGLDRGVKTRRKDRDHETEQMGEERKATGSAPASSGAVATAGEQSKRPAPEDDEEAMELFRKMAKLDSNLKVDTYFDSASGKWDMQDMRDDYVIVARRTQQAMCAESMARSAQVEVGASMDESSSRKSAASKEHVGSPSIVRKKEEGGRKEGEAEGDESMKDIGEVAMQLGCSTARVSEIFHPSEFVEAASRYGLADGFVLDLTVAGPGGRAWDLSDKQQQQQCEGIIKQQRPKLLVGSPMCDAFSRLVSLGESKQNAEERQASLLGAAEHLQFCARLYTMQHEGGRYFLHEQPDGASPVMQKLTATRGIIRVHGGQCHHGQSSVDTDEEGLVLRQTGWLTNSEHIAAAMSRGYSSKESPREQWHRHVHITGDRAKGAQSYPPVLIASILRGLRDQLRENGELSSLAIGPSCEEEPVDWDGEEAQQWHGEENYDA
eukprot:4297309-Amphidinium_carterae.1